ncbi:TIGR01777 family oxidoreductase [Cupriavidus basilensis]|uniref:TIGR01777 family oxidoreductase n=1 Tax=Cupriavidus basilensis TaxID=68895 RepID=UPI00283D3026|nr:TIGR01777 family oxidoreductase [Cupriavidus basilensis]MDR3381215.1 TIGR01777 family oxidoreductase [Cupriavidus basilensis]
MTAPLTAPSSQATGRVGAAPQRFLVTGGSGFIGRALVSHLLMAGHTVTVLSRQPAGAARRLPAGSRITESLQALPADAVFDVVINLAGAPILGPRWTRARKRVLEDSRIGLTQRLVVWLATRLQRPRLLVSASAIGYYGADAPGSLDEDSAPGSDYAAQLCQRWEMAARAACDLGIDTACVRLGIVLGHGGALPGMRLATQAGLGAVIGSGTQMQSWVHIADVLGALNWIARGHSGQGGAASVYNVTAPGACSQAEFVRIAARVLHRPTLLRLPGALFRLALGEQSALLLGGTEVYPKRLLQAGYQFRHRDLHGALASLWQ